VNSGVAGVRFQGEAMKIFPKGVDFFEIFDEASANLTEAARHLMEVFKDVSRLEEEAKIIYGIEQKGDTLTHEVMRRLNKTFLTPIDREDIHALASRIDDVLDLIWGAVDRMTVFRITESMPEALEIAKVLHTTTEVLERSFDYLREKKYTFVHDNCIEINRLENEVDRIFRDALGRLFDDIQDPLIIIKWKEIYEHLEDASDRCEDVANTLESIVLKHA
jgi:predicted phosphate transport protein (TIGR00153 family)